MESIKVKLLETQSRMVVAQGGCPRWLPPVEEMGTLVNRYKI